MKKYAPLLVVLVVILVIAGWFFAAYNSFVRLNEDVSAGWAQVENEYQRRYDAIPNLMRIVQGMAAQEQAVFLGVTEARSKVGGLTVTPEILKDPEAFKNFQAAQDSFSSAITRLLAVAENYPQIKSDASFLTFQKEYEGTENRIATERMRFNEVVKIYNVKAKGIPGTWLVGIFGFDAEKAFFQSTEGSETAPVIDFTVQ